MRRIVIEIKKHSKVSLTPVEGERLDYAIKRYANHLRGLEPKQVLLQDYDPRVSSKYRYTPAPALLKVLKKALLDDQLHSNGHRLREVANGHQPSAISHQPILKVKRKRRSAGVVQQSATQLKDAEASKNAKEPAGRNKIQAVKAAPVSKPAIAKSVKNDPKPLPEAKTKSKVRASSQAKAGATSRVQTSNRKTRQQAKDGNRKVSKKKLRAAKPSKAVTPTPVVKPIRGRPKPQPVVASKSSPKSKRKTGIKKAIKSQSPAVQPSKTKPVVARGTAKNRSIKVEARALAKTTAKEVEKAKDKRKPKAMVGKTGRVKGQASLVQDPPKKAVAKSKPKRKSKKKKAKAKA